VAVAVLVMVPQVELEPLVVETVAEAIKVDLAQHQTLDLEAVVRQERLATQTHTLAVMEDLEL
jgi:hypothetical protein